MRVLVACEESQRVCKEFRKRSKTYTGIAKAMAEQWGCLDIPAAKKETAEEKQTQGTQIRMEL